MIGRGVRRPLVLAAVAIAGIATWSAPTASVSAAPVPPAPVVAARLPQLTVDATAARRGSAGALAFTVRLLRAANTAVTVDYATVDGTARAGRDYQRTVATVTIPFGATTTVVAVPLVAATAATTTRTMTLSLANPVGARIENATAVGTIQTDTTTAPQVSVGDAAGYRLWGQDSSVTFPVRLSHASDTAATVHWATHDATATAPADYTAASGTVTVPAGAVSADITVVVPAQWNRTPGNFTVDLAAPVGAVRGTMTARGSLLPGVEPDVAVSAAPTAVLVGAQPGSVDVALHVGVDNAAPIVVTYRTEDGTAHAGVDYTTTTGSVTVRPHAESARITVPLAASSLVTGENSFVVRLLSTSVGVLATPTATVTLEHDAAAARDWVRTVATEAVEVGDGIGQSAFVPVFTDSPDALAVDVTTIDGTAVAGQDYVPQTTTRNLHHGSNFLEVPVLARLRPPGVTTFTVVVTPRSPAVLAPGDTGRVTVRIDGIDSFVVSGQVTDVAGPPIAGVEMSFDGGSVFTDAHGRYRTPPLPPLFGYPYSARFVDNRPVQVRAPDVQQYFDIIDRPLVISPVLRSPADVVVRVIGADGGPLRGATLTRTGGHLPDRRIVTGTTGQVVFETDGSHLTSISAAKPGLGAFPSSTLTAGPGSLQTFVLARTPFVVGYTFLLHPGCAGRAVVPANGCDDWYATAGATVTGGGRTVTSSSYIFVLQDVQLGTYSLDGTIPGGKPAQSRTPVTVASASDAVGLAAVCFLPVDPPDPGQASPPSTSVPGGAALPPPRNTFCNQ